MHRFLDLRSTCVAPRRGLHALPTLCALGAVLGIGAAAMADDPRPNIVVAIADDWSRPHAGAYGDRVVKTPAFDRAVAAILQRLDARGLAANTIVVVTSDNGMPFPRCKANLYDSGAHMPLAIRWPARVKGGRTVDAFVGLADLAPTFLEAAGQQPPPEMTGRSVLDLLRTGTTQAPRDRVFLERERHANVRRGDLSYPCRAVRTRDFLYIRNLRPDRWPAGDPTLYMAVGPFGDVDPSPSKDLILDRRDDPAFAEAFRMAFAKRPAEELYGLRDDPMQRKNIADDQRHARDKAALRAALDRWMAETADPRVDPADDRWDHYPYVGEPAKK